MKILITGGSGFLGINLIRHLLKQGFRDIVVFDIADFDYPDEAPLVTFVKRDIRDKKQVVDIMQGVNQVIHTAAALPLYTKNEIFTTDVDGTRTLLEAADQCRIERFIHISSTAVYGIPNYHPLYEDDKLDGVGPYGKAKILAEKVCLEYRHRGMCIPVLRPKTFVGPERLGVFALFFEWAKDGHGFPMIGNGSNRYQLLDVEDLCAAIYLCMTLDKERVNDTFNIGAKEYKTLKEDYQAVLDAAGYGKQMIGLPATPIILTLRLLEALKLSPLYEWIYETAAKDSIVSIEKAEKVLGYKPAFSNQDALVRNFKWYVENMDKANENAGISHRVPWKQGILQFAKFFF